MKIPHLISGLTAFGLVLGLLVGFTLYAQWTENRYIHALAPLWLSEKAVGGALQKAALRQPDLLSVYGSSELHFGASQVGLDLLSTYPTGFMICPIGWAEMGPLSLALMLAASDGAAQHKKIVISLTPLYFSTSKPSYAANFSDLNANELAFSTHLSLPLKQRFAHRMLQYPRTLRSDPILRFALQQLVSASSLHRILYYAVFPLGRLQLAVQHLQNHWAVLAMLQKQALTPTVQKNSQGIDWPAKIATLRQQAAQLADNNPFGFENDFWHRHQAEIPGRKNRWSDEKLTEAIHDANGWKDLDLLLSEAKELDADNLIVSVPMKGMFKDYEGNSPATRALYYQKLHEFGDRYGIPVVAFEDQEYNLYFMNDFYDHLSREGWAHYDQVLDAFYHNELLKVLGH
ncbi:MAG: hypothetical protein NT075_12135 [Chloroflexi bacterium]|nr:hypothetical protein [Chloroflexota bacterium]